MAHPPVIDERDTALLERIQHDVPLCARPYAEIAMQLGWTEREVIDQLVSARERGLVRQVSAIFDTRRLGYASSLVAARVAPDRIEQAAAVISAHPGVSHNYQRSHEFGLWFTIAVSPHSRLGLEQTVERLAAAAGLESVRLLPALRVYRIGVNFDMRGDRAADAQRDPASSPSATKSQPRPQIEPSLDGPDTIEAIRALQRDLPAVEQPFALLASEHGMTEHDLLGRGASLLAFRQMRRFAAVLHHRQAGFRANGMGVWIVPPDRSIDEIGRQMASFEGVSHCYARPTYDDWPYGLFSMTHGRTAAACEAVLAAISEHTGLSHYDVLYSTREFKKQRVRYFTAEEAQWEQAAQNEVHA